MTTFAFPFTTCEEPDKNSWIMQPVSTAINLISCIILYYYVILSKSLQVKLLLSSFIAFQLWHAFSHAKHIDSLIQSNMAHILLYVISILLFWTITFLLQKKLSVMMIILLFIAILFDMYIWLYVRGIWMIISGLFILILIMGIHYPNFPKYFKTATIWLILGTCILILVVYNEKKNCKKMMQLIKFPYHAFIEIIGLLLFTVLSHYLVRWDRA